MNRLQRIRLGCRANFKNRLLDWRVYLVLICTICFALWNLSGLKDLAQSNALKVTAWVFPHYLGNPTMTLVFCCLVILLFCDAPFMDSQMSQMILRMGRMDWLAGQFLYIVIASLIYTLWLALSCILVLIPQVSFANEWGRILYALATERGLSAKCGVVLSLSEQMLDLLKPCNAMMLSICLTWLVSIFFGVSMMCANILIDRRAGYIVGGCFAFFSYFSAYLGSIIFGSGILRYSPASWISIYVFDWFGDLSRPDCASVILILIAAILVLFGISLYAFCKRDLVIRQEGILS